MTLFLVSGQIFLMPCGEIVHDLLVHVDVDVQGTRYAMTRYRFNATSVPQTSALM